MKRIGPSFFQRDPVVCARELVGCTFRWGESEGRIVETEAYHAQGDAACHTFSRSGAREFVAKHEAGTAYVYLNYGVHWLFNFLTKNESGAGFVLLRGLAPLAGIEAMRQRRGIFIDHLLCAGPGRLTRAFGIDGSAHGTPCLRLGTCELREGLPCRIVSGQRIGITRDTERPWRFGDASSPAVSRKFHVERP